MPPSHQPDPPGVASRDILENVPGIVWTTDCQLRCTAIFGAVLKAIGLTAEQVVGKTPAAFLQSDDPQAPFVVAHQRALRGETAVYEDTWGGYTFQGTLRPLRDAAGQIVGCVGIAQDISEGKQSEEALRQSEQRHRAIIEQQMELVCRFTPDLILTYVNDAYCRYFGKTPEEVLGRSLLTVVALSDQPVTQARLGRLGPQCPVVYNEERVVLPSGEIRWQHWVNRAIFDEEGKFVEAQSAGRDITEAKQAAEALRESEELFRHIFEHGPLGMVLIDTDNFEAVKVNRALAEMLGYAPEEIVGKTEAEFTHPEDRGPAPSAVKQELLSGKISIKAEKRFLRRDGRAVWTRATATNQIDRHGKLYGLAMIEDITEQKEAESKIQREQETLRQLLDLYDRDRQLVSYEIHDGLAQQLAGAMMQLESYRQLRPTAPEIAEKALELAQALLSKSLGEARRLISDLRPPILDEAGIVAAVEHLVCDYAPQSEMRIEFKHQVAFHRLAPPLENALFRVVQEGLSNAARHSQSDKCLVRLTQEDGHVQVEVRDWGTGFDPKGTRKGSFGLNGIRERARLLGGKATIQTGRGNGTRVLVRLPVVLPWAPPPSE